MDPSNKRFSLSTSITLNTEKTIRIDSLTENNVQENIFEIFEKNISPLTPIIAEELKKAKSEYSEEMIKKAKYQANNYLRGTDWQELAKLTRSRTIDSDVVTYRAAVLTAYNDIKTLINNQDTIAKLAALYSGDNPDIDKWPDPI